MAKRKPTKPTKTPTIAPAWDAMEWVQHEVDEIDSDNPELDRDQCAEILKKELQNKEHKLLTEEQRREAIDLMTRADEKDGTQYEPKA